MNNTYKQQMKKAKNKGMTPLDLLKVREMAKKEAEKMEAEATERALLFMMSIPCVVLASDYWPGSAKKRMPKFIGDVLSLYDSVQNGTVAEQDLADELFEYTGIKVEAEWMKAKKGE